MKTAFKIFSILLLGLNLGAHAEERSQLTPTPTAAPDTSPAGSEISVVLAKDRFYPSTLKLRAGVPTILVFTTVNKKPAALVIEPAAPQRSLASVEPSIGRATNPTEITRELGNDRLTPISFDPTPGTYRFHDALGAARGEIVVE